MKSEKKKKKKKTTVMTPFKNTTFLFILACLCKSLWTYPVLDTNNLLENENLQNNLQAAAKAAAIPEAAPVPMAVPVAAPAPAPAPAISVAAPAISLAAPAIPSAIPKSVPSLVQPSVVNIGNSNSQISALSLNTDGFLASFNTNVLPTLTILVPATTIISFKTSPLSVKPSIITSPLTATQLAEAKLSKTSSEVHQSTITQSPSISNNEKSSSDIGNEQHKEDKTSVTEIVSQNRMSKVMEVANFAMLIPMVAPLITVFDHGSSTSTIGYLTALVPTTVQDPCSYVALLLEGKATAENQNDYSNAIQACSAKGGISMVTKTDNNPKTLEVKVVTVHAKST